MTQNAWPTTVQTIHLVKGRDIPANVECRCPWCGAESGR